MLNDRRLDFKSPKPPGAHLSHKDNADLSARKPRESEDRHPVDVEHLEVLGGAEIPDLVSGTGGLRGAPRQAPGPVSQTFTQQMVAVGTAIADRPPHRSRRALGK
jgi:hypothetical protein